jgi:hypothetical protein
MTSDQITFAAITAVLAIISVGLTIRNWLYGGSVIRVELELARRDDWGALISGTVGRWRQGDHEKLLSGISPSQVDLAKVTVRNLGRTAATIHDVGLRVGRPPVARGSWTAMANRLLDLGESSSVVRIEAHDVKVFYFHTMPIIRGARKEFGDGPLAFRAAVMTGIGKQRLSRRWRGHTWNVWILNESGDRSIVDLPLTLREQARLWVELTEQIYSPSTLWVRQITNEAARLVEAGENRDQIAARLTQLYEIFGPSKTRDRDLGFMRALTDDLIKLRDGSSQTELSTAE